MPLPIYFTSSNDMTTAMEWREGDPPLLDPLPRLPYTTLQYPTQSPSPEVTNLNAANFLALLHQPLSNEFIETNSRIFAERKFYRVPGTNQGLRRHSKTGHIVRGFPSVDYDFQVETFTSSRRSYLQKVSVDGVNTASTADSTINDVVIGHGLLLTKLIFHIESRMHVECPVPLPVEVDQDGRITFGYGPGDSNFPKTDEVYRALRPMFSSLYDLVDMNHPGRHQSLNQLLNIHRVVLSSVIDPEQIILLHWFNSRLERGANE